MALHIQDVDEVQKLYENLQDKRDKLKEQLEVVEAEFASVSTTLRLLGRLTPAQNINLSGLTQLDALVAIAKANDNRLAVKTARRLMVKAGYFKSTKHASSILFATISRSGKFERESPGVYKLIETPRRISFGDPSMYTDDDEEKIAAKTVASHP